jgi:hypothetical protein
MWKQLLVLVLLLTAGAAFADTAAVGRAAWLVQRVDADVPTLHRAAAPQSDIGGSRAPTSGMSSADRSALVRPVLLSLLMPGLGEATTGHKRGYVLMAADLLSWYGVKHYHDQGKERRQDYYDFLDAHWTEARLAGRFGTTDDPGTFFYDVTDYQDLSLWVSREDDEREYYENAGKWDQFVFGWDDFSDPRGWSADWWHDTNPDWNDWGDLDTSILKDSRVSANREIYRGMRRDSNASFDDRDKLVYLNIFTRLLSAVQVAWLQGAFSDGRTAGVDVHGHEVALIAEPRGFGASRMGFSVSW